MKVWMVCEALTEGKVPNVTVLEIRRNLLKLKHEVLLFCPSTEKKYADSADKGIYFVPTIPVRGPRELLYQLLLPVAMLICFLRSRPDWIYVRPVITMISPPIVARVLRIPCIIHFSGDMVEILRSVRANIALRVLCQLLEWVNVKLATRVIVETTRIATLRRDRHKVSEDKIVVIPNGANIDLFKPIDKQQARKAIGIDENCFHVGFAGNLARFQGLPYLVKAAPQVLGEFPNTRFLIVGDGEAMRELVEMVRTMGLSDSFVLTGVVPYEKVPLYIAASDICVAPRIKDMCEKTGISLLKLGEYMACGRPVVASDIEGVGPVLREAEAGIPVPLEDSHELAAAIVSLLKDRDRRERMGENARRYAVERLSWEGVVRRIIEVYENAVGAAGRKQSVGHRL
ncbi:MAG: glycosyltransferase family 4 protein [Chloroflexi bacterium]|nr:glycosyltransferase family 4 protein [Chloroflexota bacterium]